MVDASGHPHVVDFGLALAFDADAPDEANPTLTAEGLIAGTPAYMSPEQAEGRRSRLDTRTDVYSLGVVLYRLMTGDFPHDPSGSPMQVVHRVRELDVRRPRDVDPSIDRELEAILLKALARERQERYRSADDLADDLDRYLEGEPLEARAPTTLYFLGRKLGKHRLGFGIAAVVFAAIVIMSVVFVRSLSHERRQTLDALEVANRWAYSSRIQLAARSIEGGEVAEAQRLLEDCGEDHRHWEWSWLSQACDPSYRVFGPFEASVFDVEFSPDGRHFAVTTGARVLDDKKTARSLIYELATGRLIHELAGHEDTVTCIAFSPDGAKIVTGCRDTRLRTFDAASGKLETSEEMGIIFDIAFSRGGRFLACAVTARGLIVRGESGEWEIARDGVADRLSWSAGGRRLLWIYRRWQENTGHVLILDPAERRIVRERSFSGNFGSAAISADGATGFIGRERAVEIWSIDDGTIETNAWGRTRVYTALGGDRLLYTCDRLGRAVKWQIPSSGSREKLLQLGTYLSSTGLRYLSISEDSRFLASGGDLATVWRTDVISSAALFPIDDPRPGSGHRTAVVRLDPEGQRVAVCAGSESLRVYEARGMQIEWRSRNPDSLARTIAWSPDGDRLAAGWGEHAISTSEGPRGRLVLHDAKTGDTTADRAVAERVWALAFSPGGETVAMLYGSVPAHHEVLEDVVSRIELLSASDLKPIWNVVAGPGPEQRYPSLSFSPNGARLLVTNADSLRMLGAGDGRETFRVDLEDGASYHAGKFLDEHHIIAARGSEAILFDTEGMKPVRRFGSHATSIVDLAVTSDRRRLFTVSVDSKMKVWDFEHGDELLKFEAGAQLLTVAISPDAGAIWAAGNDGVIRMWDTRARK